MSTKLGEIGNGNINVIQFYGGGERGVCIQLTGEFDKKIRYVQLTLPEIKDLIELLIKEKLL